MERTSTSRDRSVGWIEAEGTQNLSLTCKSQLALPKSVLNDAATGRAGRHIVSGVADP